MATQRRNTTAIAGSVLLLAACSLDVKPTPYVGVWVYGRVFNEAGAGVADVQIRVGYRPMAACDSSGFSASAIAPSTDSTGAYGVGVVDAGSPHAVCVKVVATPPSTLVLAAESVLVRDIALTEGPFADSVRLDLVLPPR